jgi:hypothetical protein
MTLLVINPHRLVNPSMLSSCIAILLHQVIPTGAAASDFLNGVKLNDGTLVSNTV